MYIIVYIFVYVYIFENVIFNIYPLFIYKKEMRQTSAKG